VADSNNDGVISFPEFFFFITILQLPESLVYQEFSRADPKDLKMTKERFTETLTKLRHQTLLGKKQTNQSKVIPDARKICAKEEDFKVANEEITTNLFRGKTHITMRDFKEFREKLKTAMRHYEFHQYGIVNEEKDTISAENFVKSLLVCLPPN
jgi:hypothetical protein